MDRKCTTCGYAEIIYFWNKWPGTQEEKEECTKKIVLTAFDESLEGVTTFDMAVDCMIDFIVGKYNANFRREAFAIHSGERLEQARTTILETLNYILKNADMLAAKIVSYFSEPVTTTDQELLDSLPGRKPKDNPNLVTPQRLAGYLRWVANQLNLLWHNI